VPVIDITFEGLRDWQKKLWPQLKRFNVLVVHRRAGKTVLAILWLIWRVAPIKNGRGAYFAPLYNQARRVAWDYLKRYAGAIPGTVFNESELKATFPNGAVVYLLGADNPHAIRGIGLDACVLDEVAQMGPSVWREVIRPALADKGGYAMFIGTPFGMANQFYELWRDADTLQDWARCYLTVEETGCIAPGELDALRREMSQEEFAQEFLCDWSAAVKGAFYGKEMAEAERAGRVGRVPYDKALPVHTSWDLGFADTLVIWLWQVAGAEVRAIRCLSFQATALPDVVAELRRLPYNWGTHYLPHDTKVRELGSGRSREEVLLGLGLRPTVVPEVGVASGIEATRALLTRSWFDREGCGVGVEALKTYRTEWDDLNRVFRKQPLHSWESHYADAARYFAVGTQGKTNDWSPIDYSRYDRAVI
jgi:hypothetical protein